MLNCIFYTAANPIGHAVRQLADSMTKGFF